MPPSSNRPRRLICREVSDAEDDEYHRRSLQRRQQNDSNSWQNRSQQSPAAVHSLLGKVWEKAKTSPGRLPSSSSAPNLNSQWDSIRNRSPFPSRPPSPPGMSVNNTWQAMRNAPQPPSRPNQEAVHNFIAARNLPPVNNQANQALRNVWNRAGNAGNQSSPPPYGNSAWNQMPPPPTRYPPLPFSPNSAPRQPLNYYPAPRSFAAVLAQAHRQRLPYAGTT
jgi:hypothetical protein